VSCSLLDRPLQGSPGIVLVTFLTDFLSLSPRRSFPLFVQGTLQLALLVQDVPAAAEKTEKLIFNEFAAILFD